MLECGLRAQTLGSDGPEAHDPGKPTHASGDRALKLQLPTPQAVGGS